MIEVNKIIELYPEHYQVVLNFPNKRDLIQIIDKSYKYVWGINHIENSVDWANYTHTLYEKENSEPSTIQARNISMEFLMPTEIFINYIPIINQSVNIIQTSKVPPYYLNLSRLKGKAKYDLLKKEVDYLFELDMPGASDYTPIISPSIDYLENLIARINCQP